MEKQLILEKLYTFINEQFVPYGDGSTKNTVAKRRNLSGTLLRSSMVITSNDSLNHLSDYRYKI